MAACNEASDLEDFSGISSSEREADIELAGAARDGARSGKPLAITAKVNKNLNTLASRRDSLPNKIKQLTSTQRVKSNSFARSKFFSCNIGCCGAKDSTLSREEFSFTSERFGDKRRRHNSISGTENISQGATDTALATFKRIESHKDIESESNSSTTSTYVTASNPERQSTASSNFTLSIYQTARGSTNTNQNKQNSSEPTSEMVSCLGIDQQDEQSQQNDVVLFGSPTITPNTEELEYDQAMIIGDSDAAKQQQPTPACSSKPDEDEFLEEPDEEQLKRILACKRLSEGCNQAHRNLTRKNSLHMMLVDELPPVTEGEPMQHMSHSQAANSSNLEHQSNSSGSTNSLRGSSRKQRSGSQDENSASISSNSLDHRRSSTVSQCSSVLSETTRNQLNFDLSPDLPPDSSLLEANAIGDESADLAVDYPERPTSPEPLSFSDNELRAQSRMSDDIVLEISASPDSTLGDSNDQELMEERLARLTKSCQAETGLEAARAANEIDPVVAKLIDEVSSVVVSQPSLSTKRPASENDPSNPDKSASVEPEKRAGSKSKLPQASRATSGCSRRLSQPINRQTAEARQVSSKTANAIGVCLRDPKLNCSINSTCSSSSLASSSVFSQDIHSSSPTPFPATTSTSSTSTSKAKQTTAISKKGKLE